MPLAAACCGAQAAAAASPLSLFPRGAEEGSALAKRPREAEVGGGGGEGAGAGRALGRLCFS